MAICSQHVLLVECELVESERCSDSCMCLTILCRSFLMLLRFFTGGKETRCGDTTDIYYQETVSHRAGEAVTNDHPPTQMENGSCQQA